MLSAYLRMSETANARAILAWMLPGQQGPCQVLGNQGNLGRSVTQEEGLHAEDVGYVNTLKPNIYTYKETTSSPVFQHPQAGAVLVHFTLLSSVQKSPSG